MNPISLRASSLPRIELCPASAQAPEVRIESNGEEARVGTAFHEVLARSIQDGHLAEVEDYARLHRVDGDELAILCATGWRYWTRELEQWFPHPVFEHELRGTIAGVEITGHPDVMSIVDGEVRVLDWKTGRLDPDAEPQLKGYGWLALYSHLDANYNRDSLNPDLRVRACKVRVRDGTADWQTWDAAEIGGWMAGLVLRVLDRPAYGPGVDQCRYCPLAHECPARRVLVRSAFSTVGTVADYEMGGNLTDQELIDLYPRLQLAESEAKKARDLVRSEVAIRNSRVVAGGMVLSLDLQERRELDYLLALPVLHGYLSEGQIEQLARLRLTEVEAAVKSMVGKGQKKQVIEELRAALKERGALTTTCTPHLDFRRAVPDEGAIHVRVAE